MSDRARAEGHGIRVGDLELHPGIGSEAGYVTNLYYAPQNELASPVLRVSPHLFLSTLTEERKDAENGEASRPVPFVGLRGGVSGSLFYPFAVASRAMLGMDANLDLVLNNERPVSFGITEVFNRTATPFTEPGVAQPGQPAPKAPSYGRNQEHIGGRLMLQTPGGLLRTELGYNFGVDWFDTNTFNVNKNYTHALSMRTSWEFLPKTAIFHEASFTFMHYPNVNQNLALTTPTPSSPSLTVHSDNRQLATRIGLNGALTSRVGATVAVGYGAGFYDNHADMESLLAAAELRWTPSQADEAALGYERSLTPSFQGNHLLRNRIYVRGRLLAAGALLVSAKTGVEFLEFGNDAIQGQARKDTRIFGELSGEYRFVDWLAATAQLSALSDITDFKFSTGLPAPRDKLSANFNAFEGWLGLRAFY